MGPKQERESILPVKRDEALDINGVSMSVVKSPSHYLSEFGFTERLPVLLGDLNKKLSDLGPDPARVRMVLNPNLETPQIMWEPAFAPVPKVEIEFSPSNRREGQLSIGKEVLDEGMFFYWAEKRYLSNNLGPQLELERESTRVGDHERPDHIVSVGLKGLKDFVRRVFPKKRAILYTDMQHYFTDEQVERLERAKSAATGIEWKAAPNYKREGIEDLGLLDEIVFNALPLGGYSIRIIPREYTVDGKDKDFKKYPSMEDVPDDVLAEWYDKTFNPHSRWSYLRLPWPETFLYVSLEESEKGRYFDIRRLQYKGRAKSIERVLELFAQLFAKDPTGQSQFQADVIKRRSGKSSPR